MRGNQITNVLPAVTAALVGGLALGSLALSYDALQAVAVANGVMGWRSYIWPLLIDASLVVFSLAVVRNALRAERTAWPWALVAVYTVATVVFNLLHAPATWTAWAVAVVAPASLFLSFETLMGQLKSEVKRAAAVEGLAAIEAERERLVAEADRLAQQIDRQQAKLAEVKTAVKSEQAFNLGNLNDANQVRTDKKAEAQAALLDYLAANPFASMAEAGRQIGKGKTTVSNYVNELSEAGRLHKNGNGWEVAS